MNTVASLSLEYMSKRSVFLFEMFKMSMSGCGNSYTMVLSESSLSLSCVGVSLVYVMLMHMLLVSMVLTLVVLAV